MEVPPLLCTRHWWRCPLSWKKQKISATSPGPTQSGRHTHFTMQMPFFLKTFQTCFPQAQSAGGSRWVRFNSFTPYYHAYNFYMKSQSCRSSSQGARCSSPSSKSPFSRRPSTQPSATQPSAAQPSSSTSSSSRCSTQTATGRRAYREYVDGHR